MGSSAKKRQTFAKMTRERALQEKRELKRQKKADRKAAAAEAAQSAGEANAAETLSADESE
jgi:hypothetical protein